MHTDGDDDVFRDALQGLHRGDFSRLEPLFVAEAGSAHGRPQIVEWYEQDRFRGEPKALAEALTCACFLGRTSVAEYFLEESVDPATGNGTGLDALHWAVNRGQLDTVRLLVARNAQLETRSMYGGTALGSAVHAAIHEPRPNHLAIIQELVAAGARVEEVAYPTGDERIDAVLRRESHD